MEADREKFDRVIAEHDDFAEALKAVLDAAFDLTELEVLRNRVLVAEQSLVGLHRTSAREEEARQLARSHMRDLEFAWATFLTRGMEQGAIPQADPRLLARAILGLYNSVWHWYRPRGGLSLDGGPRLLRRALPRGRRPAGRGRRAGQAQAGEAQPAAARPPSDQSRGLSGLRSNRTAVDRPTM